MTKEITVAILKERLNKLENNGKNTKSPGVVKRLIRRIRNLEGGQNAMELASDAA